ncbi:Hypothetical Protein FCC1311_060642 [Hondaea fermentalgiana]|uniref:Uncharacterized protein n=1 Tax=Hondaea fermentalgiana TaxID=2315210 RepID=A0A2R5GPN6_9STRA|nr:Hypothetical Protein FCC1311_060642 [Hondaea fermentalgiana]|eukprot:GBG29844.1 Hypothetical Protein FCC1311_060642 [Hondaea fermentalgiana]
MTDVEPRGLLARAEATLRRSRGLEDDLTGEADPDSGTVGVRKSPESLTRLVNALRAPELEAHRELFEDLFELAVLDVRKFESAVLSESENLRRENAELRRERDEAQAQLLALTDRQTRVGKREKRVRALERKLDAEARRLQATETRLKRSASRVLPPNPDDSGALRSSLFAYMRDCEGLVGKPQDAVQVRTGLNESTNSHTVQGALKRHFQGVEAAFNQLIRSYQDEIAAMSDNTARPSNGASAAARMRERKAQREKDTLLQAMQTINSLAEGLVQHPDLQANTEVEMIRRIAQGAQESPII